MIKIYPVWCLAIKLDVMKGKYFQYFKYNMLQK